MLAPRAQWACIVHAARCYPREACGILVWEGDVATAYCPARNVAARSHLAFQVDMPTDVWDALLGAQEAGACVLGLWHSHPRGRARPSPADVAGLDPTWLGVPYVVYSWADAAWWYGRIILPQ